MSIKQVFYANSTYSLFCYLLKGAENSSLKDLTQETLFVSSSALEKVRLPEGNTIIFDKDKTPIQVLNKEIYKKIGDRKLPWYINVRAPKADAFLNSKEDILILSDGLSDHDEFPKIVTRSNVKECYSTPFMLGGVQDEKIKIFDLQQLWDKLPGEERTFIYDLFNVSPDVVKQASSRPVVVVTQPLSEDNIMSEKDKVELYRRIISNYGEENVVLKPHPREGKMNWSGVFPNIPVIPSQAPMEFLARISRLNRIATFFSTAAFGTLPEDRVDFYAADFGKLKSFHPEIELDENGYKNVAKSDIEETYRPSEKKEKETVFKCNWLRIPDTDGRFYRDIVDKRMLGKNQTIQSFRNNQHTIA